MLEMACAPKTHHCARWFELLTAGWEVKGNGCKSGKMKHKTHIHLLFGEERAVGQLLRQGSHEWLAILDADTKSWVWAAMTFSQRLACLGAGKQAGRQQQQQQQQPASPSLYLEILWLITDKCAIFRKNDILHEGCIFLLRKQ